VKQGNSSNPPVGSCFYGSVPEDQYITYTVTDKCIPKCQVGTTWTRRYVFVRCVPSSYNEANTPSILWHNDPAGTYPATINGCNGNTQRGTAVPLYNMNFKGCLTNQDTIKGTVYLNNTCSPTSGTEWNQGQGLTITATDGTNTYTTNVLSSNLKEEAGQYVNNAPNKTYAVTLSGIPAGYMCASACGGCTKNSVVSPSIGNNFFLMRSNAREAWWQAAGAGIYAGGTGGGVNVQSMLPSASTHLIEPTTSGTAGALLHASGQVDTGSGSISTAGYSAMTKYKGKKMDYDFFAAKMGALRGQNSAWDVTLEQSACTAGSDFCYGTGAQTGVWNVTSGQKYVVFVNGDLNIKNNVTVETGGFAAFIVKGNITIDPSVTTLQGIYLTNKNFVTEKSAVVDVPLNIQGNVVAWGLVDFNRDLGGAINAATPAEKVSFRPDLLTNMPDKMKTFAMEWGEVAPETK